MLDDKTREQLIKAGATEEEILKAETIFTKYNRINKEYIGDLYDDKDVRRSMKSKKLWNDQDLGISLAERYLGEGYVETRKVKVWSNYGKIRIYFDIIIDNEITSDNRCITIR